MLKRILRMMYTFQLRIWNRSLQIGSPLVRYTYTELVAQDQKDINVLYKPKKKEINKEIYKYILYTILMLD